MINKRINKLVKKVKELEAKYKYFNKSLLYEDKLTGKILHNHKNCDIYDIIAEAAIDTFMYDSDADEFLKNYNIDKYIKDMNAEYGIIPENQCQLAIYIWDEEVIENDIDTMRKVISIIDKIIELQKYNFK